MASLTCFQSMPVRNVSKSCAVLHKQMSEETFYREISTTQYLDAVKVLPLLFKPMQKKLQGTKTNLQNGIDQVRSKTLESFRSRR